MHILVCPGCRTRTPERLDVRTLEPEGDVLACACGRRYPIVAGVPIVLADPSSFMAAESTAIVERDLSPEVAELLVAGGPDDTPYARLLEHVSIYMDAHWGDRAQPPPEGVVTAALIAKVVERAKQRVEYAVELGCSVGRVLAELERGARHSVGVDLQFAAVRRARQLLAGEQVTYARRMIGRHYAPVTVRAGDLTSPSSTIVCGDALDPPLIPGMYQRVVAFNVLDSVRNPLQLLSVVDALCAPGGELMLASPYAWQSSVVDEGHRIGGADPAAALIAMLTSGDGLSGRYEIEDEAELPWALRRDARSSVTYRIHYVRARRR